MSLLMKTKFGGTSMQRTASSKFWSKWQLMNDTTVKGKGYFVGSSCTVCPNPQRKTDSRSLR